MSKLKTALAALILIALICPVAVAQESSESKTKMESETSGVKNWEFSLAPMYLWAVSIKGDQTVNGIDADLDISFSEIFDKLQGALTFHFEGVRKQSWGFFTDLNYINLKPEDGKIDINFEQILAENLTKVLKMRFGETGDKKRIQCTVMGKEHAFPSIDSQQVGMPATQFGEISQNIFGFGF